MGLQNRGLIGNKLLHQEKAIRQKGSKWPEPRRKVYNFYYAWVCVSSLGFFYFQKIHLLFKPKHFFFHFLFWLDIKMVKTDIEFTPHNASDSPHCLIWASSKLRTLTDSLQSRLQWHRLQIYSEKIKIHWLVSHGKKICPNLQTSLIWVWDRDLINNNKTP